MRGINMNGINETLIFLVIFLAGGIIGFVICRITLGRKKAGAQQQELDQTKAELEHYKSQVNDHFTSSAELMGQVASSYQALYSHMAGQSQTLLSDTEVPPFPLLKTPEDTVLLDNNELVSNSIGTASENSKAVSDSSEITSDNSKTVSDSIETASENSKAVSDSIETASENSKAVSDSIETASENSKAVSESSETVPSKQPHSNN